MHVVHRFYDGMVCNRSNKHRHGFQYCHMKVSILSVVFQFANDRIGESVLTIWKVPMC